MEFALWASPARPWPETLAHARWARDRGFAQLWFADHLMPHRPDDAPDDGELHECWTTLAGVGALVPDLDLVSMVSPTTWHHPVLLLKRAVEVGHLSGGRAVLGLGAGWQVNEHAAYGLDLGSAKVRVDRFAEAIEIISRLRTEERVDFAGEHLTLMSAPLSPKPIGSLPLVVGTSGPRMLRLTARWADGWNTWADPAAAATRLEEFHAACVAEGRDPSAYGTSVQAVIVHSDDPEECATWRRRAGGRGVVAGGSAALVDQIGQYAELNFGVFAVNDGHFGSGTEYADRLDRLADEVLAPLGLVARPTAHPGARSVPSPDGRSATA